MLDPEFICEGCGKPLTIDDPFHESDAGIVLCIECMPDVGTEDDWLVS